ncbi:MAG: ribbon-helix-helix domain-containing protein [Mariprofundaceae bacterium]|nr:ribbon-helix-helix domain-containing protein [Mariprofundaceae bacterium]
MGQTCTTSIRLDKSLAHRLDDAAARLHRRKNGIIVRAIEEYLEKHADTLLQEEARKQSLLASSQDCANEDELWESAHDDSGWQV